MPILTHPLESIKYVLRSIEPAIAIAFLSMEYKRTKEENIAKTITHYFDKWGEIIDEHYSQIDFKKADKLVRELNDLEYKILCE